MKETEHHNEDSLLMDLLYEESNGNGGKLDPELKKKLMDKYGEELRAYREIRAAYRSLEDEDPAPEVSAKILREAGKVAPGVGAAAVGASVVDKFLSLFRLPAFGWAGAAAVALLVVGVGYFAMTSKNAEAPGDFDRSGDPAKGMPAPSHVAKDLAAGDTTEENHPAALAAAERGAPATSIPEGEARIAGGAAGGGETTNAGVDGLAAGVPEPAAPAGPGARDSVALEHAAKGAAKSGEKLEEGFATLTPGAADKGKGTGTLRTKSGDGRLDDLDGESDTDSDKHGVADKTIATDEAPALAKADTGGSYGAKLKAKAPDADYRKADKKEEAAPPAPPPAVAAGPAPTPVPTVAAAPSSSGDSYSYSDAPAKDAAMKKSAPAAPPAKPTVVARVEPKPAAKPADVATRSIDDALVPRGSAGTVSGAGGASYDRSADGYMGAPKSGKVVAHAGPSPATAAPAAVAARTPKEIEEGRAAYDESFKYYKSGKYGPAAVKIGTAKSKLDPTSGDYAEAIVLDAEIALKLGKCEDARRSALMIPAPAEVWDGVDACFSKLGTEVAKGAAKDAHERAAKARGDTLRGRKPSFTPVVPVEPGSSPAKPSPTKTPKAKKKAPDTKKSMDAPADMKESL